MLDPPIRPDESMRPHRPIVGGAAGLRKSLKGYIAMAAGTGSRPGAARRAMTWDPDHGEEGPRNDASEDADAEPA